MTTPFDHLDLPSELLLRRAIAEMHAVLESLQLCVHRTKRFIGKTSHGFDFLGYQIHLGRAARPSREAYRRLRLRARRLYERGGDLNRLLQSLQRGWQWGHRGLTRMVREEGVTRGTELCAKWSQAVLPEERHSRYIVAQCETSTGAGCAGLDLAVALSRTIRGMD
jgi:hypothetical protein